MVAGADTNGQSIGGGGKHQGTHPPGDRSLGVLGGYWHGHATAGTASGIGWALHSSLRALALDVVLYREGKDPVPSVLPQLQIVLGAGVGDPAASQAGRALQASLSEAIHCMAVPEASRGSAGYEGSDGWAVPSLTPGSAEGTDAVAAAVAACEAGGHLAKGAAAALQCGARGKGPLG